MHRYRTLQAKVAAVHAAAHAVRVRQMDELNAVFAAQSKRIAALPVHPHRAPQDAGGAYSLEVRAGSTSHTNELIEVPEALKRKAGECGFRNILPGG